MTESGSPAAPDVGHSSLPLALCALADLLGVTIFLVIGRLNHHHGFDPLSFLQAWWPFAVGAAAGWSISYVYSHVRSHEYFGSEFHPERLATGVVVWVVTVAVGMVLRWILHQGTELSFIIVASCALGVLLLGWRLIARLVRPRLAAT